MAFSVEDEDTVNEATIAVGLQEQSWEIDVRQYRSRYVLCLLWYIGQEYRGGGISQQGFLFTGGTSFGFVGWDWWGFTAGGEDARFFGRLTNTNGAFPPLGPVYGIDNIAWPGVAASGFTPPEAITWWDAALGVTEYSSPRQIIHTSGDDAIYMEPVPLGSQGVDEQLTRRTTYWWKTYPISYMYLLSLNLRER